MAEVERTPAGFQIVLPGCERRTLPKSTTAAEETGQGLLAFYRPPTLREQLAAGIAAPLDGRRTAVRQREPCWLVARRCMSRPC